MAANNFADAKFEKRHLVKYDEFEPDRLYLPPPESKAIPGMDNQKYQASTFQYRINDLDEEKPVYVDFRLEGPIMEANYGIGKLVDKKTGKVSHSIYTHLPISSNEDIKFFVEETCDTLFAIGCDFVESYKDKLGLRSFKSNDGEGGRNAGWSQLYKYRKDKNTDEYLYDQDPVFYNRLIEGINRTIFVGVDGKVIPWSALMSNDPNVGIYIKFVPIYSLGFYKGGGSPSFPIKMVEAVVLKFGKKEVTSSAQDTIERFKEKYMEDYKKSIDALKSIDLGDGLSENNSTLGSLQKTDDEDKDNNNGENPDDDEDKEDSPPKPSGNKRRTLK
jgi:hypothetical protein